MKQTITILLMCLAVLTACQSAPEAETSATRLENQTGALPIAEPTIARAEFDSKPISVRIPIGWNAMTTENSILYTEFRHSFEEVGYVDGISVRVFSPSAASLEPFSAQLSSSENPAYSLLAMVVESPQHMEGATVTRPLPFRWGEYNAAYYTLSDGSGVLTLLIAVALPDYSLVVFNISAPASERTRLRQQLPTILDEIVVGDYTLHGNTLTELPAPLRYPAENTNVLTDRSP